jgi:membrane protein implicated in regulation of membrane protease activity
MPMLWSLAVVAGLVILVYLMIAGVPRMPHEGGGGATPRAMLPMLGVFFATAGITGYLANRSTAMTLGIQVFAALGVALLAALAARWAVRAAFAVPSTDPEDDPRYRFQGHVARLTEAITPTRPGRVAFEIDGHRFDLRAQSIDGRSLPVNTEVVIERIDDDLATVERWAVVEERL